MQKGGGVGVEEVGREGEGPEWVSYFAFLKASSDNKRGVRSPARCNNARQDPNGGAMLMSACD